MNSFAEYITLDESIPSRSNLYADSLPGIDSEMIDSLVKDGKDVEETWAALYKRACDGLVNDLRKLLNNKFYVDLKLVSRETSTFKDSINGNVGLAGLTIEFKLPKYSRLHVVSLEVFSEQDYASPGLTITIFDTDENGEELFQTEATLEIGRNLIPVDIDFTVDKIFISFSTEFELRETENKRYNTPYIYFGCDECAFDCGGYQGKIEQINGGGLNAFYNVVCSVEKFTLENINFFAQALLWKLGIVVTEERRYGERLTKYQTMTLERAEELMGFFTDKYKQEIEESVKGINIKEDPYCFSCKQFVIKRSSTP